MKDPIKSILSLILLVSHPLALILKGENLCVRVSSNKLPGRGQRANTGKKTAEKRRKKAAKKAKRGSR